MTPDDWAEVWLDIAVMIFGAFIAVSVGVFLFQIVDIFLPT